nr:RpiB/LacA/LacB family sugar-phosphate isomerase [Maliibacterium massiliense]
MNKRLIIAAGKGLYAYKQQLVLRLREAGYDVTDGGAYDTPDPFPYYMAAEKVARAIQSGAFAQGVLICGTGMGVFQAANKFKGISAALVESPYTAYFARQLSDSNVLCIGGWVMAEAQAMDAINAFFGATFGENMDPQRYARMKRAHEYSREHYGA